MNKIKITGGTPLNGRVKIAGAKNAASKMIIASLLTDEKVTINNVPLQQESKIARELVELVGAKSAIDDHTFKLTTAEVTSSSVMAAGRKNRLSILLLAPLLHRTGEAHVPGPGGDRIGPRPVNFHTDALQKMGAKIEEDDEGYHVRSEGRLNGALIELPYPS
ncbi:MAG: UDP-N-acetylglucosamine 1-carboxyvinyltransferase, partial [Patescibacteria group bacterium]